LAGCNHLLIRVIHNPTVNEFARDAPLAVAAESRSMTPELKLLLSCARVVRSQEDETAIGCMLDGGIDWTLFARMAIDHGLAGFAGHTLASAAPEAVPEDILDAFRINVAQVRERNGALFDGLAEIMDTPNRNGVQAIPFKGPVLALQAYGDLGFRVFQDLDFLVRDCDIAATMKTLRAMGYEREKGLTEAQVEAVQRLQGQDFLYCEAAGIGIEPHTRLTPNRMALDIDYPGLWERARPATLNARTMLTLEPEDHFLILAIHGGKELWWNIKWTSDIAAFIASHPHLDWTEIVARARAQGCSRMVLLAASLARKHFAAPIPEAIAAAVAADAAIEPMTQRIVRQWLAGDGSGPPSNNRLSMDRLRLHDGAIRRARYAARTWLLPGPKYIASIALPRQLGFAYVPFKLVHDLALFPLWRAYRKARSLIQSIVALLTPISSTAKQQINRNKDTCRDAKRVLAIHPDNAAAWNDLGNALKNLGHCDEAVAAFDKALALIPDHVAIWKSRAAAITAAQKQAGATGAEAAVAPPKIDPKDANGWALRAGFFLASHRFAEAVAAADCALEIDPRHPAATRIGIHCRLDSCDWRRRDADKREILTWLTADGGSVSPFIICLTSDSEEMNFRAARARGKEYQSNPRSPLWRGERYGHDKIRIAYLSSDFGDHPVAYAIAGCFEHHDQSRFETIGISLASHNKSRIRKRIASAFDRFIDVENIGDAKAAGILRDLEVDIAIDLNGYTGGRRTGILAHRPAPVQVNYLGFPGTMGLPFVDYIIADPVVIPLESQVHYSEKIVRLPWAYLPGDNRRPVAESTPLRARLGLPETGFVYCCFNNPRKITSEIFDIWMRLLHKVEHSVLWLLAHDQGAILNLRREAKARGIAPERLVFAPRTYDPSDHLARFRAADLFLDTLPYNAHATASDALWAGLPVLTSMGKTFPGRVAASLLHAIGIPELVTQSLAEYENLALALAQNSTRLAGFKARLLHNREAEPLFDTARFTRDLESAYRTMWERQESGLAPANFSVSP
jgi:protein O-GlcNAc transferase